MVAQFVIDLHVPISEIRLERYRPKDSAGSPVGSDLEMLVDYFWNMALAESLYPSLHAVELALRNTIHATLTRRYGTEEWWHQNRVLLSKQLDHVRNIEKEYLRKHSIPITPGRMIAELNFGFWTTLLSQPYESRIWRYRNFAPLAQAFPHAIGFPRHDIHQHFNEIRLLRNRTMHYEAIYHLANLVQKHALIHQTIQWISPELHRGIHAVDNFSDIHAYGRQQVYNKLHGMLGGP